MASPSKILLIGATGYIGKSIAKASIKLGHPTFILVRDATPNDSAKASLLKSFTDGGATLVVGDLYDHASLVKALKQVDVVISTVGGAQLGDQVKILDAIKEAGTIKRFVPSEFGNDVGRLKFDIPATNPIFETKLKVRQAIEKAGVPYTIVLSGSFAGYFLAPVLQDAYSPPREGKLVILGDGNAKAIFATEDDIGTFTIKAVDDPRTKNKLFHIKEKESVLSSNEVIAKWEKLIGHTFEKEYLDEKTVRKSIDELPVPQNILRAIKYSILVKGDQTNFTIDPSKEVEATELYPDVKYTTAEEYLKTLV